MVVGKTSTQRDKLEAAIAAQENLRGTIDDAIIDATISALRKQLADLEGVQHAEGQRKLATVLFVDIVDSTRITRHIDPEDNLAIMEMALQRMTAPVEAHGGRVMNTMGDGFLALFGYPLARENDPEMAVRTGLNVLEAARGCAQELEKKWDIQGFHVRVGVDTGFVVIVGEAEGQTAISGSTVNLASRVEHAAEEDSLYITHRTYQHVRGFFEIESKGPIHAKGFDEPVRVYRVLSIKPWRFQMEYRGIEGVQTRMIGRETELRMLQDAWLTVVEERELQVMTVVGEAGVGKSRLMQEFEAWGTKQFRGVQEFKSRGTQEIKRVPYGLLRGLFAYRFNIQESDAAEQVRDKIEKGILEVLGSVPKAHLIGQLVGYDFSDSPHIKDLLDNPKRLRDMALESMVAFFRAILASGPIAILLEDLHWTDDSSLDALVNLMVAVPDQPLLIVGLTRPALYERRPHWGEGQPFHTRLDLNPLTRRASRQLVAEILHKAGEVPHELRELVVEGAEGNPFYVEELIKMLVEQGVIVLGEESWQIRADRLVQLKLPPTLTGVLQARLDRLQDEERLVMQQASVVGRLFWDGAVAYINQASDGDNNVDIRAVLRNLRRYEMVFQRETSTFARVREYYFKHVLLREVTYRSVFKSLRRQYHGLAADWLVQQVGDRLGEYVSLIADHLERAGRVSEALQYLRQAGEAAGRVYANSEAIEHYRHAIALGKQESLGIAELGDLFMSLGRVMELNSRFEEAMEVYGEMELLARQQGEKRMELTSLVAQVAIQSVPSSTMNFERSQQQGEQALNLLNELEDHALEARLLWSLSLSNFWTSKLEEAISCGERSLKISREHELEEQLAQTLNDLGSIVFLYSGHLQEAIEKLEEASLLWRKQGNLPMLADSLSSACVAHTYMGNYEQAIACAEEALEISQSIDNLWGQSYSQWRIGYVYREQGRYSLAIRTMEESIRLGELAGFLPSQTQPRIDLGILYGEMGEFDRGVQNLRLAMDTGEANEYLADKAYLLGGLGELYLQIDELERAEKYILEGVNLPNKHIWAVFHIFALISNCKLEIKKGKYQRCLEIIEVLLSRINEFGMRSQLPYVLLLRGKALLGNGDVQKARTSLQAARVEAEALGSRRSQWQTLYALSQLEESPEGAVELLSEARRIVKFILDHIDDEHADLRESFSQRPEVREILEGK